MTVCEDKHILWTVIRLGEKINTTDEGMCGKSEQTGKCYHLVSVVTFMAAYFLMGLGIATHLNK